MRIGISGLLYIEDICVSRIKSPFERFSIGQEVKVMVKSIDKEENKISFTYKELLGTWEDNIKEFKQGTIVSRNCKRH
ncbi:MAG: S1 RNA-binding domain-containing protein [Clostridia bacterium]|nr:S1 RNA-binding domain-containing protein [Clostridia bacterium]